MKNCVYFPLKRKGKLCLSNLHVFVSIPVDFCDAFCVGGYAFGRPWRTVWSNIFGFQLSCRSWVMASSVFFRFHGITGLSALSYNWSIYCPTSKLLFDARLLAVSLISAELWQILCWNSIILLTMTTMVYLDKISMPLFNCLTFPSPCLVNILGYRLYRSCVMTSSVYFFRYHGKKGLSGLKYNDSIKLPDLKNPLVSASVLTVSAILEKL